jgi:Rrf2 family protein
VFHGGGVFMLTLKTRYAVRALAHLARAGSGEPVLIAEIARAEQIPRKFLEHILSDLGQHAIVRSRKGRHGGYWLARPAKDISMLTVIRACEGSVAPVLCLERSGWLCDGCTHECPLRRILRQPYEAYASFLDIATIQMVVDGGLTFPSPEGSSARL